MKQDTLWSLAGSAAAVAASMMARKAADKAYQKEVGDTPPANPDEPDVEWRQALLWGAATGVLVGVARVVGRRAGREVMHRAPRAGKKGGVLPRLKR
ncbi:MULTISPECIES: DUF4235 domain-containing protein [unclassified Halomonas]|uniref:DUF4235 domain-containing protein n=1 Tax=unclassified Halomonas TaxID=2609666 RepID=UPI002884EBD4|nr:MULTISPECIES: DUF4235 domain-containing protein [unclassified Halomonas]MDT0499925.1 DUF4235 domain-containing protein [Halomonas sp. PAR7]MDT0512330.1 DUF4235 domain-containing protein [Halomonas sp. LES1]MDT0590963.1 DUF4235 domain-containing protein [Halomonas sp. PAR8]